jgi:hypothetical protein
MPVELHLTRIEMNAPHNQRLLTNLQGDRNVSVVVAEGWITAQQY